MQIKGLHKGIYKLYGYARKQETIKKHKVYKCPVKVDQNNYSTSSSGLNVFYASIYTPHSPPVS